MTMFRYVLITISACISFSALCYELSIKKIPSSSLIEFDCPDSAQFADTLSTCLPEPIDLYTYLPSWADPFGVWSNPFGSFPPGGGASITPGVDVQGVYTYSWADSEGCFSFGTLTLFFTEDSDSDGICDDAEIAGCQDPEAVNYNPEATDPGSCSYVSLVEFDGPSSIMLPEGSNLGGRPAPDFSVYPNPLQDGDLTVSFEEPSVGGQLVIYDLLGKVIFERSLTEDQQTVLIPASTFTAQGIYFVSFAYFDHILENKNVLIKY
jgi:hypothetical protein